MNMEAVFGHLPLLESEKLVLNKNKIEEKHVQDVFYVFISSLVRCHIIFVLFGDAVLTDPAEEAFCRTFFSWERALLLFYALCSFSIKNSINHSSR